MEGERVEPQAGVEGMTALITGASNRTGIGCAIARRMAAGGASIILTDIADGPEVAEGIRRGSLEALEEIAAELAEAHDVQTLALPLDVTQDESVQTAFSTVGATPASPFLALIVSIFTSGVA